ncbi:MAG: sigma 54-interacting transcriptional regulator, partial [Thermoanaerobaculia bacterium]|nr:sigma 54-interacting transcriptional regulator [Thermoanaerobaculia bacterium]
AGRGAAAERVEVQLGGPWRALRRFLELAEPGVSDLRRLARVAGAGTARLELRQGAETVVVLDGTGGGKELTEWVGGRCLRLRSPAVDDFQRCLLHIVADRLDDWYPASAGGGRSKPGSDDELVGRSEPFLAAMARVDVLAPSRIPVLVEGETGTGKELVARRIHRRSERSGRVFLPLNCAALSDSLLLSELFGHARGSFTGAVREHAGVFETAAGGTVFLDEIGDLPPAAQGSLLRVLQEGEVRRLGETRLRRVDVRVVAATHRDLERLVAKGVFRRDLFYRLKAARVKLPPLRERGSDVVLLARHFLAGCGSSTAIGREARTALESYVWPGNVRELRNTIEVADRMRHRARVLTADHLDLPQQQRAVSGYHAALESERRRLVVAALEATGGRKAPAARRLGITPQALAYLVRRLDLAVPRG